MIDDYLNQTGTLLLLSGSNAYGESTWSTGVSVGCRVQHGTKRIVTETGAEVVSETQVFLKPDQAVAPGAKFTFEGRSWQVVAVRARQGTDGVVFKLAYLGG